MLSYLYLAKYDYENYIKIAQSKSPSSSFKSAYFHAINLDNLPVIYSIGIAKATRHLAIIRRDKGIDAFNNAVDELRKYAAKLSNQLPLDSFKQIVNQSNNQNKSKQSNNTSQFNSFPNKLDYKSYKFADYTSTIADYRKSEIEDDKTSNLMYPSFPLDIFYACYYFNLEKSEDFNKLPNEAKKIIEEMESSNVREITVGNEILSRFYARKVLSALQFKLSKEKEIFENEYLTVDVDSEIDAYNNDNSNALNQNVLNDATIDDLVKYVKNVAQKIRKANDILKVCKDFGLSQSEMSKFDEYINIESIDISELLKNITKVDFGDVDGNFDGFEISGIESGIDLNSIVSSDLADDDDIFYLNYATESLNQYKYESKKSIDDIFILIDKSGSMKGSMKMNASRSIAMAIMMKSLKNLNNVNLLFFDEKTYPNVPLSLKKDRAEILHSLLTIYNDGGTNIKNAIKKASEYSPKKIVLITDAEDNVDCVDLNGKTLITCLIGDKRNNDLEKISKYYFQVSSTNPNQLKKIVNLT